MQLMSGLAASTSSTLARARVEVDVVAADVDQLDAGALHRLR